jgi:hypothetical protein
MWPVRAESIRPESKGFAKPDGLTRHANAARFSAIDSTWCGMWLVMLASSFSNVIGPASEWMPRRWKYSGFSDRRIG